MFPYCSYWESVTLVVASNTHTIQGMFWPLYDFMLLWTVLVMQVGMIAVGCYWFCDVLCSPLRGVQALFALWWSSFGKDHISEQISVQAFCFLRMISCEFVQDRVSCSPGYPRTLCSWANFDLSWFCYSASWVPELQAGDIPRSSCIIGKQCPN